MVRAGVAFVAVWLCTACDPPKVERDRSVETEETDEESGPPSSSVSAGGAVIPKAPPPPPPLDARAVAALGLTAEGTEALRTLAAAPHFGGWAVGAAGSPTPPVVALRQVVQEKNASKALQLVLRAGTDAAQLMALAGLFDVDPAVFKAELPAYRAKTGTVRLMTAGCDPGGDPTPIGQIVEQQGAVQLNGPTDGLSAWSKRNPNVPIEFDIAGGGYAAVMRPRG